MEVRIIEGDIANQSADAIVNAAGTSLRMGSGVAGALRRRGGEALNEAAVAQGSIDLGAVAVTDAYGLDADIVIHAAAMPKDGRATASSITEATTTALAAAEDHGCRTVVLPVLGTGAADMAFEEGARLVCEAVAAFDPTSVETVSIIAYGDEAHAVLSDVWSSVSGE